MKKIILKIAFLFIFLLILSSCKTLNSNLITIKGVVLDELGPIPGAHIKVQGRNLNSVKTDLDGNYLIQAKKGDTLIVSYSTHTLKKIKIENNKTINIVLDPNESLVITVKSSNIKRNDISSNQASTKKSHFIIVNEKIVNKDILDVIDSKNIESVKILKNKEATAVYGQNAKNGAILITTKDISKRELKKLYKKYKLKS